jgi:hypothetical protein
MLPSKSFNSFSQGGFGAFLPFLRHGERLRDRKQVRAHVRHLLMTLYESSLRSSEVVGAGTGEG